MSDPVNVPSVDTGSNWSGQVKLLTVYSVLSAFALAKFDLFTATLDPHSTPSKEICKPSAAATCAVIPVIETSRFAENHA